MGSLRHHAFRVSARTALDERTRTCPSDEAVPWRRGRRSATSRVGVRRYGEREAHADVAGRRRITDAMAYDHKGATSTLTNVPEVPPHPPVGTHRQAVSMA